MIGGSAARQGGGAAGPGTRFLVLGPLAVVRDGAGPVAPTGRRERSLLAALLAHRNEVVAAARLVEHVWDTPITDNALQARVSHLRRALGLRTERLVHLGGGYRLRVGPGECDDEALADALGQARALLGAARAGAAVELLDVALTSVRGEPYSPCEGEPLVVAAASRLRELVRSARELHARAVLEAGDAARAAALATSLVAAEPLRQDARVVLMRALDGQDRRAEALAVYDDGRRLLADATGLEPAPALRAAHAEILAAERTRTRTDAAGPGVLEPPDMIRWLAGNGHGDAALELAVRCAWGWWLAGERGRGRKLLSELLAGPTGTAPPGTRLAARLWAAALSAHERDEPAALNDADRALAEEPATGTAAEALALLLLADRRTERGQPERAAALMRAAEVVLGPVALGPVALGPVAPGQGGPERGSGHEWERALAALVAARAHLAAGRPDEAERQAAAALHVFQELADPAGQLAARELLGYLAEVDGRWHDARRHHERALILAMHGGWPHAQCLLLLRLGSVVGLGGNTAAARQRLGEALAIARRLDSPSLLAFARTNLALVDARAGDRAAAARGHRQALAWFLRADSESGTALSAAALARVAEPALVPELLDRAERAAMASGDPRALAYVAESRAVTAPGGPAGDAAAADALARAAELRRRTGRPGPPGEQPDVDARAARLGGPAQPPAP